MSPHENQVLGPCCFAFGLLRLFQSNEECCAFQGACGNGTSRTQRDLGPRSESGSGLFGSRFRHSEFSGKSEQHCRRCWSNFTRRSGRCGHRSAAFRGHRHVFKEWQGSFAHPCQGCEIPQFRSRSHDAALTALARLQDPMDEPNLQ